MARVEAESQLCISVAYYNPCTLRWFAKFVTVFSTQGGRHVQLVQRLEGGELRSKSDASYVCIMNADALCKPQLQDGRADAVADFATANGSRPQEWRAPMRHMQG